MSQSKIDILNVFADPSDVNTDINMVATLLGQVQGNNYRVILADESPWPSGIIIIWRGIPKISNTKLLKAVNESEFGMGL